MKVLIAPLCATPQHPAHGSMAASGQPKAAPSETATTHTAAERRRRRRRRVEEVAWDAHAHNSQPRLESGEHEAVAAGRRRRQRQSHGGSSGRVAAAAAAAAGGRTAWGQRHPLERTRPHLLQLRCKRSRVCLLGRQNAAAVELLERVAHLILVPTHIEQPAALLLDRCSKASVLADRDKEGAQTPQPLPDDSRVHLLLLLLLLPSSRGAKQPLHLHNTQHHANQVWPFGGRQ
jgi:hypothetical protein